MSEVSLTTSVTSTSEESYREVTPLVQGNFNKKADQVKGHPHVQVSVYNPGAGGQPEIRTYWWRWVVLTVFCLNLGMSNFIWVLASPVADVFTCYYNVSDTTLNLLSMCYMITYILFVFPFSWMLDRYGLRLMMMLAACATVLGAGLRLAATGAQYFWLLLSGQAIASLCNALIWGAAPFLSEVWFPPLERATATAFSGAIAPNAGVLIGLGLGPIIIHNPNTDRVCNTSTNATLPSDSEREDWDNAIYNRLFYYLLGQSIMGVVILMLTFVAFPKAPPTAPSMSRYLEERAHKDITALEQAKQYLIQVLSCLKNVYFLLFLIPSGIMIGAFSTVASVIDEVVHPFFPNNAEQIAYLGIVLEASAILSMLAIGFILDRTKLYYVTNLTVIFGAAGFLAVYASLIQFQTHFNLLYPAMVLVGITTCSYQALAYEYGIEMTYPVPEGTSAGVINVVSQVITIGMLTYVGHFSGDTSLVPYGTWLLVGSVVFGAVVSVFIRPELRRVKIDKEGGATENTKIQSSAHF